MCINMHITIVCNSITFNCTWIYYLIWSLIFLLTSLSPSLPLPLSLSLLLSPLFKCILLNQVVRIQLSYQHDLVSVKQDLTYPVWKETKYMYMYYAIYHYYLYLLVAISTLMLPRGSNPSNWLISSSIVLWTSLLLPSPSLYLVPSK